MLPKELIQRYYTSLKRKDDLWKDMYSETAVFADPSHALYAKGRTEIIQSFVTFLKGVTDVNVKQWIVEDDSVCAIVGYEYVNPKGERMSQDVAEVWRVAADKLAELTIYFDLTAYRSFMRG